MVRKRGKTSFTTRVTTCPTWGTLLAVGGPSKKTNSPAGDGFSRVFWKTPRLFHSASTSCSSWGNGYPPGTSGNRLSLIRKTLARRAPHDGVRQREGIVAESSSPLAGGVPSYRSACYIPF